MSDFTAIFSDSGGGFTPQLESTETFDVSVSQNESSGISVEQVQARNTNMSNGNYDINVNKTEYDTGSGRVITSYNDLTHIPTINGFPVTGDKQCEDYNIQRQMQPITNDELKEILV